VIPNSHPVTGRRWEGPAVLAGQLSTSRLDVGSVMIAPLAAPAVMQADGQAAGTGASTMGAAL